MKKNVLLAALMVALVAMPAFASVQNIKVSGDIDSTFLSRHNFDLGANIIGDRDQNVFLTQTRLRVDADLTDNVSAVVGLINERAWGAENDPASNSTNIDLNVAYVTMREMLYSPLTVKIGRQNDIRYGNGLIFDSQGPNNQSTGAFATIAQDLTKRSAVDGIRAILDYKPLTIDLLYSKIDANTITGAADKSDDIDFYGFNANYSLDDSMNTVVEAYFFGKVDKSTQSFTSANKSDTVYTPGLRASTNPIKGLNVQGEVAWQGGTKVTTTTAAAQSQQRQAMAAQFIANYQLPFEQTAKWNPVVTGAYTYTSGDTNASEVQDNTQGKSREKWTAWDPLFETQASGAIYNSLYDLTNSHIYYAALQVNPIEDLTAKVSWTGLWLDREIRAGSFSIRQPDGGTTTVAANPDKTALGNEIDADFSYAYTEDVTLGLSLGWYIPGGALTSANDDVASQALVHAAVNF